MARPKKYWSIRRNGDSVQVFEHGVYVGSIGLKYLCEFIRSQKNNHTEGDSTQ